MANSPPPSSRCFILLHYNRPKTVAQPRNTNTQSFYMPSSCFSDSTDFVADVGPISRLLVFLCNDDPLSSKLSPRMFNPVSSLFGLSPSLCIFSSCPMSAGGRCRIAFAFAKLIVFCWYVVVIGLLSSRSIVAFISAAIHKRPCWMLSTAK